jgi:DNA-binding transcriptional ArsR family regulator
MDATTMTAACASTRRIVDQLTDADLDRPTPCTDWTVRQLLNHLIGTLHLGRALLGDAPPAVAMMPGDLPEADILDGDPAKAYRAGAEALLAAAQPDAFARMHPSVHAMTAEPVDTDAVMRALAERQRRRVVQLVRDGERPAGEIAESFDITPQAVSQHLRVLKDAGVLSERREGTRRIYALRPEAVESLRAFVEQLWPNSLDSLEDAVERDTHRARSTKKR